MSIKELKPGIYEQPINQETQDALDKLDQELAKKEKIDEGLSSILLSQYIKSAVREALDQSGDQKAQFKLVNDIVSLLSNKVDESFNNYRLMDDNQSLVEIKQRQELLVPEKKRPLSSLTHSYLFTGDTDMKLVNELNREIVTADRIDMLVSFLKVSGLDMIRSSLQSFTSRGGKLRIISTTYMGATDLNAVKQLSMIPNTEIRISYDTKHTRLHAKSYMFYRNTGFNTAYIGSSNLSGAAITDGREWNVKITSTDQPDVFQQMQSTFDIYWNNDSFTPYTIEDFDKLKEALSSERQIKEKSGKSFFSFDIQPYPFQQVILDKLEAERVLNNNSRNLVVAATGTGKTVISAFDYRRFRENHPGKRNSLLFVAHREEILLQSRYCFRTILKDPNFGDMLVGDYKPEQTDYLFASIQSINSKNLTERLSPDYYDFIIVDEFHHASAESYQDLLSYFKPRVLLGLTATPERMDGEDILKYFDGQHFAAEIRLGEAIDRQLLCPFHYFGVSDGTDLSTLKWTRSGYDTEELEKIYVLDEIAAKKRATLIINTLEKYINDLATIHCIGFCVSQDHAKFMADFFCMNGLKAINLDSNSSPDDRKSAIGKLKEGKINYIFVVNLYNEGVDIPCIDTIMFLRPTESLTIFLQQLGRGLRISEGKEFLTVFDFIGQANKNYKFAEKLASIGGVKPSEIKHEIKEDFSCVPKGCYIELDKVSKEIILNNISAALGERQKIINLIKEFAEIEKQITLEKFIDYSQVNIRDLYKVDSFYKLCIQAGVLNNKDEILDNAMKTAFPKFATVDSQRFLKTMIRILESGISFDEQSYSAEDLAILDMFRFTIHVNAEKTGYSRIKTLKEVEASPLIKKELIELFKLNLKNISFIDYPVDINSVNPLDAYCTYTRDQILAGLGYYSIDSMRQGVLYIKDKKTDIFLITLNKSEKEFTPSTRYEDYAINSSLFHWQSQSTTSDSSPMGQRYINHKSMGSNILLFVREKKNDKYGAVPFTLLGSAEYVQHEGSKPMSIVWKLKRPIPARFITSLSRGIAL